VTRYAGLASRTLAFALDAAIINAVAWAVAAIFALCLSLFSLPNDIETVLTAIGAVIAIGWCVAYFAYFWSATGQTPGDRALNIQVLREETGEPPHLGRALLRVPALLLSAIPFLLGFLMILVDGRRKALHDHLVGTIVIYVREPVPIATHPPAESAEALH
jgi:uncharacterized RDD family membrane protein YckC